jgi:biopolymer transport protein ExbD
MGASTSRGRGPIADINVTPLVDVVLVLLIIFMVVTTFDEEKPEAGAIPIQLPGAATAEAIADDEPFTVAVAANGDYVLKGKPATPEAVVAAVREAQKVNADLEVVVGADKNSLHERFVALLDLLRTEGVTRFAIQADAPGG